MIKYYDPNLYINDVFISGLLRDVDANSDIK